MFKENFIRLCNQKGVTPTAACAAVGLSNATFSCWTETSVPRRATLIKFADYFGVTVDDLLAEPAPTPIDEAMAKLTASMQEALDSMEKEKSPILRSLAGLVKNMTQDQQKEMKKYAEYLISRNENT